MAESYQEIDELVKETDETLKLAQSTSRENTEK